MIDSPFVLDLKGSNAYIFVAHAGIAQLVERNLAKVDVAGSSPVSRSVLDGFTLSRRPNDGCVT